MEIEQRLTEVMGEFARTLATDFSIEAILHQLVVRIVDVLPISGAGVTLMAPGAQPRYVAASDQQTLRFERLQSQLSSGPCSTAYESGRAVAVPDVQSDDQFPELAQLAEVAGEAGMQALFSFPLRQGNTRFGALDLYRATTGPMDETAMVAAQTLADVAAAYLLVAQARVDLEESSERELESLVHDEQTSRALRTSEEGKTAILASALDAIITIDGSGQVTEFNPAAERIFGYSTIEAGTLEMAALVSPPEELDGGWASLDGYLSTGEGLEGGRRVEVRATHSNGTTFPVEVSITAVKGVGPPFFTAFIRDLTLRQQHEAERAKLERRVHQTERLESVGQLAGGVAHDFNNLLTVILNYACFIAEDPGNDETTRAQAGEIVASAERAARLTHQLLMFARREPMQHWPIDLNAIVIDIRALLERAIGESVNLVVDTAPGLPLIDGDRGQLEQLLMNLAVNARDAMPDGGTLTIETKLVERGGDHLVSLIVHDTGTGMSAAVAARAMEPFFTTKGVGEGSGLGLATVYGVVTESGGTVDLVSELGVGTTVTVVLPATTSPVAAPFSAEVGKRLVPGAGQTILVVEDQAAVRVIVVAMLQRNGYQVLEADCALYALELAATTPIDLLLTDVVMPEVSGQELAEQLRARVPDQKVLFVSGHSGGLSGALTEINTDDALIRKPFKEASLLRAVAAALAGTPVGSHGPDERELISTTPSDT